MHSPQDPSAQGATFRSQPELSAVRVLGDDRVSWLNGQITNDVRQIPVGGSVHALAVNVRGKIMSELWVVDRGSELWIISPRSAQDALLASLEHFIIMEDVTLEPLPDARVLTLTGPGSDALYERVSNPNIVGFAHDELDAHGALGSRGYSWLGTDSELRAIREQLLPHAAEIDAAAYELTRLRRAVPQFGVDFDEHHYPQEAGLKAYVSFSKGCYLGQEVVCTLENRGRLTKHLCALRGAPGVVLEAGTQLSLPQQSNATAADSVGTITSSVWDPRLGASLALGYVRRIHATVGAVLLAGTQSLTLVSIVGEADAAHASQ